MLVDRWLYSAQSWRSKLGDTPEKLLILKAKGLIVELKPKALSQGKYALTVKEAEELISVDLDNQIVSEYGALLKNLEA